MNKSQFFEKLHQSEHPVLVELWAPWCGPCRAMAPALDRVAKEYHGRVDLLRINADEFPELVRDLGVMGIPTLIAYQQDKELFRKSGAQSLENLQGLFASALAGEKARSGLSMLDRWLRAGAGMALAVIAGTNPAAALLFIPAGLLLFSAVYDRCPIYRAVALRIKSWIR